MPGAAAEGIAEGTKRGVDSDEPKASMWCGNIRIGEIIHPPAHWSRGSVERRKLRRWGPGHSPVENDFNAF